VIDLRQKSIVVTGGASGIGAAICTAAYEEGAAVGIIDIDSDAAVSYAENLALELGVRLETWSRKRLCMWHWRHFP